MVVDNYYIGLSRTVSTDACKTKLTPLTHCAIDGCILARIERNHTAIPSLTPRTTRDARNGRPSAVSCARDEENREIVILWCVF